MLNILKKLNLKSYSKYNEITNDNHVISISLDDYLKLPLDIKNKFKVVMTVKKQNKKGPTPPTIRELLYEVIDRLTNVENRLTKLENRFDNLVAKNNLVE